MMFTNHAVPAGRTRLPGIFLCTFLFFPQLPIRYLQAEQIDGIYGIINIQLVFELIYRISPKNRFFVFTPISGLFSNSVNISIKAHKRRLQRRPGR